MVRILGLIFFVSVFSAAGLAQTPGEELLDKVGPINRNIPVPAPKGWLLENPQGSNGDNGVHAALWDPDFLKKHPPTKTETREIVVVGAGVSGILSATEIKDRDFLLLDQNPYLGGNSTGQEWNGVSSETGASFVNIPEKGDAVDVLFQTIGIADKMIKHPRSDNPVMVKKADGTWGRVTDIWSTGTTDADQAQFNAIRKYYEDMGSGKEGASTYPQIPFLNEADRKNVLAADKITARANFEKIVGGPLQPLVEASLDHWVWSDNAVTIDEASPATVDNFLGVNFSGIASFPGGNAFIVENTLKYWAKTGVKDVESRVRTSSLVRNIKVVEGGVDVTYVDGQGVVTLVHSKAVVFAGAKFIAGATIEDLEPARVKAFQNLKYRGFVTATLKVKLDKPIPREKQFYDMYLLDPNVVKAGDAQAQSDMQGATDVIGSFSDTAAVFTFFYPLPYKGARSKLLNPASEDVFRAKIMSQFSEILAPELGLTQNNVVDLVMERRGHPMIATLQGNYTKGITDIIRNPFKGKFDVARVFFVNQDNWLLPAFETILAEVKIQMKAVVDVLNNISPQAPKKPSNVTIAREEDSRSSKKSGISKSEIPKGCPFRIGLVSGQPKG